MEISNIVFALTIRFCSQAGFRQEVLIQFPDLQVLGPGLENLRPHGRQFLDIMSPKKAALIDWMDEYLGNHPELGAEAEKIWQQYQTAKSNPAKGIEMKEQGPPLWNKLHKYAAGWNGNVAEAEIFLSKFQWEIPCGDCRAFWQEIIQIWVPCFTDATALLDWTIEVHNLVNIKLRYPLLKPETARALYVK